MTTTCTIYDSRPISVSKTTNDDMALVRACKTGDAGAFEQLVKRHEKRLFRLAHHITQNREDAEDVVQEAFLKAFRNLNQFRENSQFSTWLVRIAINQSLMKLRKLHRGKEVQIDQDFQTQLTELSNEVADWVPEPEKRYRVSELREILIKELQELQPALSLVFLLRDVEGLSTEQVSEALQLTQAAVRTRLMRARLQLRTRLSNYFRKQGATVEPPAKEVSH